jgi:hypothetical protein
MVMGLVAVAVPPVAHVHVATTASPALRTPVDAVAELAMAWLLLRIGEVVSTPENATVPEA